MAHKDRIKTDPSRYMLATRIVPARWPRVAASIAATVLATGAATLLALLSSVSTHTAALAYVLAVLVATMVGGLTAGLVASLLSFLALNFLFTPSLDVNRPEDVVAIIVFLVVSVTVATTVSTAIVHRTRAERREQEARLLHHFSNRLLMGDALEDILQRFVTAVTELLGLTRCEIVTELLDASVAAEAQGVGAGKEGITIPMMAKDREIGSIRAVFADGRSLSEDEQQVLEMFAGQLALALGGMRLAARAKQAQFEADMSKARAALFSSVTHDLRTPLASILAATTTLQDPEARLADEDRRELLDTIRQETERLNRVVGNVLQLSRSRAGALTLTKTRTAMEDVVNGALARLESTLEDHPVQKAFADDLPEVPIDVVQVDQLMTNVLENAARFSPPAGEITVSAQRLDGRMRVEVSDRGPGIPPRDRERVFEPFVTGSGRRDVGTGLGLAISKAIVEAHGGRIWIADAPAGGALVVFELPVQEER